jgi:hypothetical protein
MAMLNQMLLDIYIKPIYTSSYDKTLFIDGIMPDLIESIGDNFNLSIYIWAGSYLNFCVTLEFANEIDPNLDKFYEKNKEIIEEPPLIISRESNYTNKHPSCLLNEFIVKNKSYVSI